MWRGGGGRKGCLEREKNPGFSSPFRKRMEEQKTARSHKPTTTTPPHTRTHTRTHNFWQLSASHATPSYPFISAISAARDIPLPPPISAVFYQLATALPFSHFRHFLAASFNLWQILLSINLFHVLAANGNSRRPLPSPHFRKFLAANGSSR